MAKVYMPLLSAQASGKLAKSMVHFYWKGLNVVRQWVIPTNPRDVDQRIVRQKLAAIGKNLKAIETPSTALPAGSSMYQLCVAETPANMIWNAHFVKNALEDLKDDSAFIAYWSSITNNTCVASWQSQAAELGFVDLTGAMYATTVPPEVQLAMGAYAAYKLQLSGSTTYYSTYPSNWVTADIVNFATDYVTAT